MIHRVVKIEGGGACPAQWEGETDQRDRVYARYRWGYLRVEVGDEIVFGKQLHVDDPADDEAYYEIMRTAGYPEATITSMIDNNNKLRKMCEESGRGHSYRGTLSYEELKQATKGVLTWP